MRRHVKDPFTKLAKQDNTRSRAYYKFEEIVERFKLFPRTLDAQRVVDLGSAPGGWSVCAAEKLASKNGGLLVSVDLLPMEPVPLKSPSIEAHFIQGDFTHHDIQREIEMILKGERANLIISDMLHNTTGNRSRDHDISTGIVDTVLQFATRHLAEGGTVVAKLLDGNSTKALVKDTSELFTKVKLFKPKASRKESAEMFLICTGFRH